MMFILRAQYGETEIAQRLGAPDYSYTFVLREYRRALARLGKVAVVESTRSETDSFGRVVIEYEPSRQVDSIFRLCEAVGEPSLLLDFAPPHATLKGLGWPSVPVFAWEFADLPRGAGEGAPLDDWITPLRETGRAITHSSFSVATVRAALGDDFPVVAIPAPVWERMQPLAAPDPANRSVVRLETPGRVFDSRLGVDRGAPATALGGSTRVTVDLGAIALVDGPTYRTQVEIDGVVYSTILNPADGRKNWLALVRAFCLALADRPDATLVVKLAHVGLPEAFARVRESLLRLPPFRCRVVVIDGYLDGVSYRRLIERSQLVVNAASGEGQCLPLMEAMSAGRPAIAPAHTGLADYVDESCTFVVRSTKEPCAFPRDSAGRLLTWHHPPDFGSLAEAFASSWRVVTEEPGRYREMSRAARTRTRAHCSEEVFAERLKAFLGGGSIR